MSGGWDGVKVRVGWWWWYVSLAQVPQRFGSSAGCQIGFVRMIISLVIAKVCVCARGGQEDQIKAGGSVQVCG